MKDKQAGELIPRVYLKGFWSVDEVVEIVKKTYSWFDHKRLFLLIALDLLPRPIDDLPLNVNAEVFCQGIEKRILAILERQDMSPKLITSSLPQYESPTDRPIASTSLYYRVNPPEAQTRVPGPANEVASDLVTIAVGTMVAGDRLFADFVCQFFNPRDKVGMVARVYALSECIIIKAKEWLEISRRVLQVAGQSLGAAPLSELFNIVSQAEAQVGRLHSDFEAWLSRVNGHQMKTYSTMRTIVERHQFSTVPLKKQGLVGRFLRNCMRYPQTILAAIVFAVAVGASRFIPRITPLGIVEAWVIVAAGFFQNDFRRVRERGLFRLSVLPYVDSILAILIFYAAAYWLLYLNGSILVSTLGPSETASPLDFIYFSVVTMTTTGFGDIVPLGWPVRLMVCSQIVVGLLYTVVIAGILISRLPKEIRETNPTGIELLVAREIEKEEEDTNQLKPSRSLWERLRHRAKHRESGTVS